LSASTFVVTLHAATPGEISVHQASGSVMRYHVSLPGGWTAKRSWPVLVVIPDAGREFRANLEAFVAARGDRPFILVAPEVLSCGGQRSRTRDHYSYSPAEWDSLQKGDDFAFEDAGLSAVLADVSRQWKGESKGFLTGWEAGGHTVWAQAFRHPEHWRAVAPVTTNYQRRGVDPASLSRAKGGALLIQAFRCDPPDQANAGLMQAVDQQVASALADARTRGFNAPPVRIVPGANHGPLAEAVVAWCDSVRQKTP
jgi:dienelactone hydrolase